MSKHTRFALAWDVFLLLLLPGSLAQAILLPGARWMGWVDAFLGCMCAFMAAGRWMLRRQERERARLREVWREIGAIEESQRVQGVLREMAHDVPESAPFYALMLELTPPSMRAEVRQVVIDTDSKLPKPSWWDETEAEHV